MGRQREGRRGCVQSSLGFSPEFHSCDAQGLRKWPCCISGQKTPVTRPRACEAVGELADAAGRRRRGAQGQDRRRETSTVRQATPSDGRFRVCAQPGPTVTHQLPFRMLSSMHPFGRRVRLTVATSHVWTCHYIEQEFKMPTAHSAVLQMPVFLGGLFGRVGGGLMLRQRMGTCLLRPLPSGKAEVPDLGKRGPAGESQAN